MSDVEVYCSTDIETDGPIPARNSMLSFATAAYTLEKGLVGTFSANLLQMEGAKPDPKTMREFWDKNPEAWAAARKDPQPIEPTMRRYVEWVSRLPGKPVFVGYPAGFDFTWVYWYIIAHGLESPYSFSALDIKSYVSGVTAKPFRQCTKRNMPKRWFPKDKPHTHVALDDAKEQGELFVNILRENLTRAAAQGT